MKTVHVALLITLFCCAGILSAAAQDRVQESSTGKSFPVQLSITNEGKTYTLSLTGTTVRKKMIFKVYGIAHHMEDPQPGSLESVIAGVLTDGKAKQITMEFVRDVDVEKIQGAYRDGFKENTTEAEAKAIAPLVDQFLGYFKKEIKENDRFVLQWLPGGVIIAETQGTIHPPIKNVTFAKALWSIWMGEESIVDREELVERIVK
jgi:hypothetical protein